MLRISGIALAIVALLVSAPSIASARQTVGSTPSCTGAHALAVDEATRERASDAILCLINGERAKRGLAALRAATTLASAATDHSAEMVAGRFMSHASADGGTVKTRAVKTGYLPSLTCTSVLGETIAYGIGSSATPVHLVSSLMKDASLRRTMLDRRFRDVGVGLAMGAPMAGAAGRAATVTVDFGRR